MLGDVFVLQACAQLCYHASVLRLNGGEVQEERRGEKGENKRTHERTHGHLEAAGPEPFYLSGSSSAETTPRGPVVDQSLEMDGGRWRRLFPEENDDINSRPPHAEARHAALTGGLAGGVASELVMLHRMTFAPV